MNEVKLKEIDSFPSINWNTKDGIEKLEEVFDITIIEVEPRDTIVEDRIAFQLGQGFRLKFTLDDDHVYHGFIYTQQHFNKSKSLALIQCIE